MGSVLIAGRVAGYDRVRSESIADFRLPTVTPHRTMRDDSVMGRMPVSHHRDARTGD